MEISTLSLNSVRMGFRAVFDTAYQGVTDQWWRDFTLEATSTGAEEEYHWLGAVPGLRELVDEVQIKNLVRHGYTIKNKEWEDTIGIRRADIERDKLGVYTPLVSAMAEAAAYTPGDLLAELLVGGFTATDYTGKAFFAADKKAYSGAAKTFTNYDSGAKKLSQANFRAGRKNLVGRLNAEGRAMRLGKDLVLVCSPTYQTTALEICNAEKIGNNTNVDRGTARPLVLPELLSHKAEHHWFLLEAGTHMKPFILQHELRPQTNMVTNLDDSHVVKHQEFLFQAYARFNAGYGMPELAYGSTGANAA